MRPAFRSLKRIFSSHSLAAVHHARNLLQAEGIRSVVKNEFLASAMGDLPPAECQAEVWLLDDGDSLRAEKILFESRQGGEPWACTACGETAEPQFTHCWRCGEVRPA
jgi:hypothetical protein